LQKKFSCYETQQLILGTGTAIWWVTEPHWTLFRPKLPVGQMFFDQMTRSHSKVRLNLRKLMTSRF
jgi:hypothetical protein